MINRRLFLGTVGALGLMGPGKALALPTGIASAARDVWIYGLPLIEMANTRSQHLARGRANRLTHVRQLADPRSRLVTSPNNDTLYSGGWFDLSAGPVSITVPDPGNRYMSIQILDMYTNTSALISKRTFPDAIGSDGATFTLVPRGHAASGPNPIEVATPHGWIIARILTDGGDDLPLAHSVQDRISLSGPEVAQAKSYASRNDRPLDYFLSVVDLMQSDPPPSSDSGIWSNLAALGLAGGVSAAPQLSEAQLAELEAGVSEARQLIAQAIRPGRFVDGWSYPPANLGNFGSDYLFRAIVALVGLAANTPDEAMYLRSSGDDGRYFHGEGLYRLHMPAPPPVDAFWSLTMYEVTTEGQLFLTPNALNRYSIGDRTPGLRTNSDGSLDIWISREDPGRERAANWLPAPQAGPFSMTFRAYWPRQELVDGRYRLQPIERL